MIKPLKIDVTCPGLLRHHMEIAELIRDISRTQKKRIGDILEDDPHIVYIGDELPVGTHHQGRKIDRGVLSDRQVCDLGPRIQALLADRQLRSS